jgi:pimeloyl-ACP methyl ester carboxylesterase
MPFVELRNQRFHYEDTGGDGPAIVFSHGYLMDHSMFSAQVAEFAHDHRVVTWDWRGFGQTETDGSAFSVWDQVDDLFALLDHLGIERAVLAGMSHGGYITMRTPLVAAYRVRAIILIDTNSQGLGEEGAAAYRALFEQWMTEGPTDELCETFGSIIIGDPTLNEVWKQKWQSRPKDAMREACEATVTTEDLRPPLTEIGCPALVIHGVDDVPFPPDRAHEMARLIPGSGDAVLIPGGHAARMTHADEANRAIREFLASL